MNIKKIGIQGIKGCFHEMAAEKYFYEKIYTLENRTFNDLCINLRDEKVDFAMMAIENTLAGSILANYSLIEKYGFYITGEVYLPIQMHLMVNPGVKLSEIREVISHPVALAQCENYLLSLKNVELKEYHDTAAAARWIQENKNTHTAAVAGKLAAELYNLEIIQEHIETHKENFTRFLILSNHKTIIEERNKASISLKVNHNPGSLSDILLIFKQNKVNLTKIQSIPIVGKPYQYSFHIDLTWENLQNYQDSLTEIAKTSSSVHILGEYISGDYGR